MATTVYKGDSVKLYRTLTNQSGQALDLSALAITCTVKRKFNNAVLKTGTKAGGEVTYTDNTIKFCIENDNTEDAGEGLYDFHITVTETDADFSDNENTQTIIVSNLIHLKAR